MPKEILPEGRGTSREEGRRAALEGPKKVGAGETLTGVTAPTSSFSLQHAPVLELVDRRDLHSRVRRGRSGSNPDWGTFICAASRDTDNST